jgi:leader peptidase (prepilin peptidase)/N-methyltransferase
MGEGDVKLMGAIGAFCGWQGGVFALFGGAVLGTIVYVSFMLAQMILGTRGKKAEEEEPDAAAAALDPEAATPAPAADDVAEADDDEDADPEGAIPFGPALAAGAICYLFWFKPWVAFYFYTIHELFMQWARRAFQARRAGI